MDHQHHVPAQGKDPEVLRRSSRYETRHPYQNVETEDSSRQSLMMDTPCKQDIKNRLGLDKQEKYPPQIQPFSERAASIQKQSWERRSKTEAIQEKSEVEQDQDLQFMMEDQQQPPKSVNGALQFRSPQNGRAHLSQGNLMRFHGSMSDFYPQRSDTKMTEQAESIDSLDISKLNFAVGQCALFCKRQQLNEADLRNYQDLIRHFFLIKFQPVPLNLLGQHLATNGYFAVSLIRYLTCMKPLPFQDIRTYRVAMFEMFSNRYNILINKEEFDRAYSECLEGTLDKEWAADSSGSTHNPFKRTPVSPGSDQSHSIAAQQTNSLKRKSSDDENSQRSRSLSQQSKQKYQQKYLGRVYKNPEGLVVHNVINCMLGNMRQFMLVKTSNSIRKTDQYMIIPKWKSSFINHNSVLQSLKQAEFISKSTDIYFVEKPGAEFNHIYKKE